MSKKETIACNGCGLTEEYSPKIQAIAFQPAEKLANRTRWFTVIHPPQLLGLESVGSPAALHQEKEEHFCEQCWRAMTGLLAEVRRGYGLSRIPIPEASGRDI